MTTRRDVMIGIAIGASFAQTSTALAVGGGTTEPFSTPPSKSAFGSKGGSTTTGLRGVKSTFPEGRVVIDAKETMTAWRSGGFEGSLTATCRRERSRAEWTINQSNYAYKRHVPLPSATLWEEAAELPPVPTEGFKALSPVDAFASQFGKNDHEDEGTGDPNLGLVQTNSEVFGASIKISLMVATFGENWKTDPRRLGALIDVFNPATKRAARLPLVDVGPGESVKASVDLTWSSDRFLGTDGQAPVRYRLLLPV